MAGLLPVDCAFDAPRLSLGYRDVTLAGAGPLGSAGQRYRGHEFHYATFAGSDDQEPLFLARDATGADLGPVGSRVGNVMGSFMHLIDRAP